MNQESQDTKFNNPMYAILKSDESEGEEAQKEPDTVKKHVWYHESVEADRSE